MSPSRVRARTYAHTRAHALAPPRAAQRPRDAPSGGERDEVGGREGGMQSDGGERGIVRCSEMGRRGDRDGDREREDLEVEMECRGRRRATEGLETPRHTKR